MAPLPLCALSGHRFVEPIGRPSADIAAIALSNHECEDPAYQARFTIIYDRRTFLNAKALFRYRISFVSKARRHSNYPRILFPIGRPSINVGCR